MKKIINLITLCCVFCGILQPVTVTATQMDDTHSYDLVACIDVSSHRLTCVTCSYEVEEEHHYDMWKPQDENNHVKSCCCSATVTALHNWEQCSDGGSYICRDCNATKTENIPTVTSVEDVISSLYESIANGAIFTEAQIQQLDTNGDLEIDIFDLISMYCSAKES